MKEKVLGILGGMGPYATVDFFKMILDCTPARKDWEHLHILMDNNVKIPSRTRAVLYNEASPVPDMIHSINRLAVSGADFVIVPCNSAHYFYEDVVPSIDIPWLNIIEITSAKVRNLGMSRPLILGGYITTTKQLYSRYIPKSLYLARDENAVVEGIIEELKLTAALGDSSRKVLRQILKQNERKFDCVVLACTELPLAYKEDTIEGFVCVNSSLEYAKTAVKYARKAQCVL